MKNIYSVFFILVLNFFFSSENIYSQTIYSGNNSTFFSPKNFYALSDTLEKRSSKNNFQMKKSPFKAVLYSAILPGAGQFYNKSYWKIPIIAGLGGYFVYEIVQNNNSFLDYKDQYLKSQTSQNPDGDLRLKNLREFYRDQRDDFIIYSVILYVVNLIDAYVDAQLYDFDVSDKIKLSLLSKNKLFMMNFNF